VRRPYLLSALAAAAVVASLALGYIGMLPSGRPALSSGEFLIPTPSDWRAHPLAPQHGYMFSGGRCYEITPPVEGDPPGHVRAHETDSPICSQLMSAMSALSARCEPESLGQVIREFLRRLGLKAPSSQDCENEMQGASGP
jgi:hypothetical protein